MSSDEVVLYVTNLKKQMDYKKQYFNDIRRAAESDDVSQIFFLLEARDYLPLIDPVIDVFLLNYCISYLEKNDIDDVGINTLFEQILDTSDNDVKEYSSMIARIFKLPKSNQWFEDFYQQLRKLILRSPVNRDTYSAVEAGLMVADSLSYRDLSEFLRTYLNSQKSILDKKDR